MPNGAVGVVTEVVQKLVTLEHKLDQDHAVVIDTVERKLVQDQVLQAEAVMSMFDVHVRYNHINISFYCSLFTLLFKLVCHKTFLNIQSLCLKALDIYVRNLN